MAVDETLVASCRRRTRGPTLRVYGWNRPAISVGYFQHPDRIVDLDRCREAGIPVVKRTTGGRAVYHHHEVTYSVTAPVPHPAFPPTIRGTYEAIARALEAALSNVGVPAQRRDSDPDRSRHGRGSPLCFDATSRNEIAIRGKKVIGSAQRRWPTAFLQHGSILLQVDPSEAMPWFRGAAGVPDSITGLSASRPDLTPEKVCRALIASWQTTFGVDLIPGGLSADETSAVAESSHARDLTVTQTV